MATDILRFAILGLGAGAIYGVTALGVVLVYRGSGVVNFAHGAIGMIGAFVFYTERDSGTNEIVAWSLALGVGALIGGATHLLLMRPLRRAPALARLIATLGVFTVLFAWAQNNYGVDPQVVRKLLSVEAVEVLPDIAIGRDRLSLLGIGLLLTVLLTAIYRWTRFGIATSAVAESRRVTAAQGVSPDVVATLNWALGSVLAVAAAILVVNVAGLQVIGLTLLIVPALAAALVGGFRSYPLTLIGGLLIGVLQSEVVWFQTYLTAEQGKVVSLEGWGDTVPFLIIILVLVVRGRALPVRGEAIERPPEVGTGRIPLAAFVVSLGVIGVLVATVFSTTLIEAVTTSAAIGVIALSLVVVTGYAGQLSLAQFALAGMGAWVCASLMANEGTSFGIAALAGVGVAIPVGVLVGLPSLRARGVNLAVATLGLAVVIQAQVLSNGHRTGGVLGLQVGARELFGIDFDPLLHPDRYAFLAVGCLGAVALLVANLRRGRAGRRLVAVRTNERAAAALGIGIFGAKLYAFGLGSAIAAVGGILIIMRRPTAVFLPTFSTFESIFLVVYGVIGGIGFVLGAVLAGAYTPGAFISNLLGDLISDDTSAQLVLGVVLFVVLLRAPDGLAWVVGRVSERLRRRRPPPEPLADAELEPVTPTTLEARDLGVRFGGVVALEGVSITMRPGEVVGLIGPNGAGKTTLIDAVTGFIRSSGDVLLDDRSVQRWSPRRRARAGIGRSFQSLELFETMTVRENLRTASDRRDPLAYLSDLFWPRRSPLTRAAVAAVREFGLEEELDRRPDELPFGRRRLVAIARAVAARPSVLLLDEPASGLDEHERAELGDLVRRLAREWNLAVLLVEHDVSLVLEVCDRVTVLEGGRLLASGSPEEIRQNPAVATAYLGTPIEAPPAAEASGTSPDTPGRSLRARDRVVIARGLSAGYGDLAAVRNLDLDVWPGEVVALLGPNGAGKTTTLLTLAGELPSLRGDMDVVGTSTHSPLQRRARAGLAFVPEERAVISTVTVGANLRLGRGELAVALEHFPELRGLLSRRAGLLSGGEQRMLTLGRALAARPRLLIVDELSIGLAPLLVQRLLAAIRAAADQGVGVLLVEQHATEVLNIADRVLVMQRGQVTLTSTAAELRANSGRLESAYLSELPSDRVTEDA